MRTARSWPNFCSHLKLKLLKCRRIKSYLILSCPSLQHSQSQYRSIPAQHYKILTEQFTFHLRFSLHLWFVANLLCFFFVSSYQYRGSSKNTALSCFIRIPFNLIFRGLFYRIENGSPIFFFPSLNVYVSPVFRKKVYNLPIFFSRISLVH